MAQLVAISSGPVCCLGEEAKPLLITTSLQEVVECNEVSFQPPLFQTKQSQLPQPLLIRLVLQTPHQFCCSSLDTFQGLSVFPVVRSPKLDTVLEVQPHQGCLQGDDNLPAPAGHTISNTGQDGIGLLGHLGTLLGHVQLSINQHPQVPFLFTVIQHSSPSL